MSKQPDACALLEVAGIQRPAIGFYDTPDPTPHAPFMEPRHCLFEAFDAWMHGQSIHLSEDDFSCDGAGYWLCGAQTRSMEELIDFLVDREGLKESKEKMRSWVEFNRPYQQENDHIVLGPLVAEAYPWLKTVTFFVDPDQLALLLTGAQYNHEPSHGSPVVAPFGSGCMQLAPLFEDLSKPQAMIGATDIAMRQHLPAHLQALTVTVPMFERLCALDEDSFLQKGFWKRLRRSRDLPA